MCVPNSIQAKGWLVKAANKNVFEAQYLLALELISGVRIEKNEDQGMYWLKRAASLETQGNDAAKLRMAWILATHPIKEKRDAKLALHYLNSANKEFYDKQTYYKTEAAVYAENEDFATAEKSLLVAIKDATNLSLPVTDLKLQLQNFQNKQALREEL